MVNCVAKRTQRVKDCCRSMNPTIGLEESSLSGTYLEMLSGNLNIQLFGQNPRGVNIERREVDRLLDIQNTL